jgi:hypothetical protein
MLLKLLLLQYTHVTKLMILYIECSSRLWCIANDSTLHICKIWVDDTVLVHTVNGWSYALLLLRQVSAYVVVVLECLTYVMLDLLLLILLSVYWLVICLTIGYGARSESIVLTFVNILWGNPAHDFLFAMSIGDGVGHIISQSTGVPCHWLSTAVVATRGLSWSSHTIISFFLLGMTLLQEAERVLFLRQHGLHVAKLFLECGKHLLWNLELNSSRVMLNSQCILT